MPASDTRELTNAPLLLTVSQVAELTQLGVRTVWRHISTGEFPAPIAIGRAKRWERRSIENWISAKVKATQK